jgi:hypothetical protein
MQDLVNPIQLDPAASTQIHRDGFLKIAGLFTPAAVEGFRALLADQLRARDGDEAPEMHRHAGSSQFAGYSNNVDLRGDLMENVRTSPEFRRLCASIEEGQWLLTQGLGFEITPGQRGLTWHWGFRSFSFIRPEDQGYTLWIPLDDVDVAGQNGGLPVVSERVYSGREETKMLARYCHGHADDELTNQAAANFPGFCALRNGVLDREMVQHSFAPGDALLFNRFVFHRSAPFLAGPQLRRRAFVTRLIPASARYNPALFASSTALFKKFGLHTHEDPVGMRLGDLREGDPLGDSPHLARLF